LSQPAAVQMRPLAIASLHLAKFGQQDACPRASLPAHYGLTSLRLRRPCRVPCAARAHRVFCCDSYAVGISGLSWKIRCVLCGDASFASRQRKITLEQRTCFGSAKWVASSAVACAPRRACRASLRQLSPPTARTNCVDTAQIGPRPSACSFRPRAASDIRAGRMSLPATSFRIQRTGSWVVRRCIDQLD